MKLDQLLAEVRRRGFFATLYQSNKGWACTLRKCEGIVAGEMLLPAWSGKTMEAAVEAALAKIEQPAMAKA